MKYAFLAIRITSSGHLFYKVLTSILLLFLTSPHAFSQTSRARSVEKPDKYRKCIQSLLYNTTAENPLNFFLNGCDMIAAPGKNKESHGFFLLSEKKIYFLDAANLEVDKKKRRVTVVPFQREIPYKRPPQTFIAIDNNKIVEAIEDTGAEGYFDGNSAPFFPKVKRANLVEVAPDLTTEEMRKAFVGVIIEQRKIFEDEYSRKKEALEREIEFQKELLSDKNQKQTFIAEVIERNKKINQNLTSFPFYM